MRFLRSLINVILPASAAAMEDMFGNPVHDAMIAAGVSTQSRRFSLQDMKTILNCTNGTEAVERFEGAIPNIIEDALEKRDTDTGRILEFVNETFSVGRNYAIDLKGVTVSCIVDYPWIDNIQGAAYASHVLAYDVGNVLFEDPDPRAYNLSMLLEADVIELPVSGLLFIPKKYCLDFRDKHDSGISAGGASSLAATARAQPVRLVSLGTRASAVKATLNRVTWIDTQEIDSVLGMIRRAYDQPKAELLAVTHVVEDGLCSDVPGDVFLTCLVSESLSWLNARGVESSIDAAVTAIVQTSNMFAALENWFDEKFNKFRVPDASETDDNYEEVQALRAAVMASLPVSPLLFDRSVAEKSKNAPTYGGVQMNPFLSQEELMSRIAVDPTAGEEVFYCVQGQTTSAVSTSLQSASLEFPGAMNRRSFERLGAPENNISRWSHYRDELWENITGDFLSSNSQYLSQDVSWSRNRLTGGYDLQPGNLTNRALGRAARWLMTSSWGEGPELQDLFEAQQRSPVYSEVSTKSVVLDDPCGKAATTTDILLAVLAMAVAAFGAVDTIIDRLHKTYLWWKYDFKKYRCQCEGTRATVQTDPRRSQERTDTRRDQTQEGTPTWLQQIGVLMFFALYVPAVLNIISEFEVENFRESAVGFEVNYGRIAPDLASESIRAAFVTMVYAESRCEDARPGLLLFLFLLLLAIGLFVNAPIFYRAVPCLCRYPKDDGASTADEGDEEEALVPKQNSTLVGTSIDQEEEPVDENDGAYDFASIDEQATPVPNEGVTTTPGDASDEEDPGGPSNAIATDEPVIPIPKEGNSSVAVNDEELAPIEKEDVPSDAIDSNEEVESVAQP